jgi:hypothetical protein
MWFFLAVVPCSATRVLGLLALLVVFGAGRGSRQPWRGLRHGVTDTNCCTRPASALPTASQR